MTRSGRVGLAVIAAVWLATTFVVLTPGVTRPDGAAYVSWLPSVYFDGDLLLFDEWQELGMVRNGRIYFKEITPQDHLGNHWTTGPAIWWAPSFVAADVVRAAVPSLHTFRRNGISLPYNVAVASASALAGLLALLISYVLALRFTSVPAAAVSALAVWFGSPLLFYSLKNSLMSHAVVAMATACVTLLALRLRDDRSIRAALLFGIATGFAFAVRPQNLPFVLLPLILIPLEDYRSRSRAAAAAAGGFLIGCLPQLVASHFVYGSAIGFLGVGGNDPGRPWRAFERVWFWEPILSWYHGLATWTPLLIIAMLGWFALYRRDRRLAVAAMTMFGAQWLINATMERSFWGAFAFGQRRFDNCTVFFILGLAMLFDVRRLRSLVAPLAFGAVVWTLLLSVASSSRLDLNRYYTPAELMTAMGESLHDAEVAPLVNVPARMRPIVALLALVGLSATALTALGGLVAARRDRWWAAIPATFIALAAVVFAAGMRDAARVESHRTLIDFNRALGIRSGGSDTRLALLEYEYDYLVRTERDAEAARTLADLQSLKRMLEEKPTTR